MKRTGVLWVLLFLVSSCITVNVASQSQQPTNTPTPTVSGTTLLDLIEQAPNARWGNFVAGTVLPFPGNDNDIRGFALYRFNATMENGNTYPKLLETHPQWVDNGGIMGWYGPITINNGCRFIANVGFLNAPGSCTDGVEFRVNFKESVADTDTLLIDVPHKYNGILVPINTSLESIAGKTGYLQLIVLTAGNSCGDWATWTDAKVIQGGSLGDL